MSLYYHRNMWNGVFFLSWYFAALSVGVLAVIVGCERAPRAPQNYRRQQQHQQQTVSVGIKVERSLAAAMKLARRLKKRRGEWRVTHLLKWSYRPSHRFKHWWAPFKGEQRHRQRQHLLPADSRWSFTPSHHGWLWGDPAECRGVRSLPEGHTARAKPP